MNRLFNVEKLVAVITGGGTGIGLMMATALEHQGATVYIMGRRAEVLEKAARENSKFGKIIPLEGDITSRDSLLKAVEKVKAGHGYIDLLVNNAGIAKNLYRHPFPTPESSEDVNPPSPSPPSSPKPDQKVASIKEFQRALWDTGSPEDFAESFATNTTAIYYTTVAFLDLLHQGNIRKIRLAGGSTSPLKPPYHSSQVISVSSSGSFRVDAKIFSASYTLSKHACTHLGKILANLLAPWGIRSNVLAPGVYPSEMTEPSLNLQVNLAAIAESTPSRRLGTGDDIAGFIMFMASEAGSYVNGSVLLVDGGRIGTFASSH